MYRFLRSQGKTGQVQEVHTCKVSVIGECIRSISVMPGLSGFGVNLNPQLGAYHRGIMLQVKHVGSPFDKLVLQGRVKASGRLFSV